MPTVWKNEKFTLTKIIFRQINSLVIYLVNALVSRNFCQKSVRVNFRNFHSVMPTDHSVEISWFFITQILREIISGNSRSAKPAILTHLEALNFSFCDFLHFLKAKIYQINHFQSLKNY